MLEKLKALCKLIYMPWAISAEYAKFKEFRTSWERHLKSRVDDLENRIGEHTVVHADIHYRTPHQVIVIGQYRNRDYVRVFNVEAALDDLVEYLRKVEKNAKVGRFDMPHSVPFSVVYERDRF